MFDYAGTNALAYFNIVVKKVLYSILQQKQNGNEVETEVFFLLFFYSIFSKTSSSNLIIFGGFLIREQASILQFLNCFSLFLSFSRRQGGFEPLTLSSNVKTESN
jgi:hypothetical protein